MKFGMKFSVVVAALAPMSAIASSIRAAQDETLTQSMIDTVMGQTLNIPEIGHRSLQSLDDLDSVRLGDSGATVTVTIDQTAVNGAATYGDRFVVIRPPVSGRDTKVTCTATMHSSLVNMQFFLRKAIKPDKDDNGEAKEFDCAAMDDNNFLAPDIESCTVTNFNEIGDLVVGYVAVLDNAFNMGATYTINFVCNAEYPERGGCFSKDATVDVLGKGPTNMEDLVVGDKVYTGDAYEPIYAFAHLDKTTKANYLHISTNSHKAPLEVTEDHLLLVHDKYVPAKAIKVGDILEDGGAHEEAVVKKITRKEKTGLYAPLTPSGTLVVNGIHTSAYVSLLSQMKDTLQVGSIDTGLSFHFINHVALSPIRMACMGISASFCSTEHISEKSNGYAPFVNFWFQLIQWFDEQALPLQFLLVALFFCVVGPVYALESLFGAALTPILVFLGIAIRHVYYVKKTSSTYSKIKTV